MTSSVILARLEDGLPDDPSVESHDYAWTMGFERLQMHAAEEKYARLDAGFFCPAGLSARAIIKEQSWWAYLGDIARLVLIGKTFVPGVRKVDHEYGTPYFTGRSYSASGCRRIHLSEERGPRTFKG